MHTKRHARAAGAWVVATDGHADRSFPPDERARQQLQHEEERRVASVASPEDRVRKARESLYAAALAAPEVMFLVTPVMALGGVGDTSLAHARAEREHVEHLAGQRTALGTKHRIVQRPLEVGCVSQDARRRLGGRRVRAGRPRAPLQQPARDPHRVVRHARLRLVVRPVVVLALMRDGVALQARPQPHLPSGRAAGGEEVMLAQLVPEDLCRHPERVIARGLIACHRTQQLRQVRVGMDALNGASSIAEGEGAHKARPFKERSELQPARVAGDAREVGERLRHAAHLLVDKVVPNGKAPGKEPLDARA